MSENLEIFLLEISQKYVLIDRFLKETFGGNKQYEGRTQYCITTDFDEGTIKMKAELFLWADNFFKKVDACLFSRKKYKTKEIEEFFRQAIRKYDQESNIIFFEKGKTWREYNKVRFTIANSLNYTRKDLPEKLAIIYDDIAEKIKKRKEALIKIEILARKIDDVRLYREWCTRCNGYREDWAMVDDMLKKLVELTVKKIDDAKDSLEELKNWKNQLKSLVISESNRKFLNDFLIFLAPRLEKESEGEYYKLPRDCGRLSESAGGGYSTIFTYCVNFSKFT